MNQFTSLCERQYAWGCLEGKWVDSRASLIGKQVHAAFELLVQGMDLAALKTPGPLPGKQLLSYLNRFAPIAQGLKPRPGGIEQWFEKLRDGTKFVGKIDLVSETTPLFNEHGIFTGEFLYEPCVIDFKTTANPRKIPSLDEARKSLQTRIYSLATNVKRAGFIYFLPTAESLPRGIFPTFSEASLRLTERWLRDTLATIEQRWENYDRPAQEGGEGIKEFSLARPDHPLCSEKWCPYWKRCLGKDTNAAFIFGSLVIR